MNCESLGILYKYKYVGQKQTSFLVEDFNRANFNHKRIFHLPSLERGTMLLPNEVLRVKVPDLSYLHTKIC